MILTKQCCSIKIAYQHYKANAIRNPIYKHVISIMNANLHAS